jgi:hypothetical protein
MERPIPVVPVTTAIFPVNSFMAFYWEGFVLGKQRSYLAIVSGYRGQTFLKDLSRKETCSWSCAAIIALRVNLFFVLRY